MDNPTQQVRPKRRKPTPMASRGFVPTWLRDIYRSASWAGHLCTVLAWADALPTADSSVTGVWTAMMVAVGLLIRIDDWWKERHR